MSTAETDSHAFVIIPFGSVEDAVNWANHCKGELGDQQPVLVTPGSEREWLDSASGRHGTELTLEGGWRAKFAGGGTVTIAADVPLEVDRQQRNLVH